MLSQRYLQGIVVGFVIVGEPEGVTQIRELGVKRSKRSTGERTAGASLNAIIGVCSRSCRVSPPWAEAADTRRLVQVDQTEKLRAVVSDVIDIHGECAGES